MCDHRGVAWPEVTKQTHLPGRPAARFLRTSDARYRSALSRAAGLGMGKLARGGLEEFGRRMTVGSEAVEMLCDGRYFIGWTSNGFVSLTMVRKWTAEEFRSMALEPLETYYREVVYPAYRAQGREYLSEFEGHLEELQAGGVRVILARLPQFAHFRASEEREIAFDETMRALAARRGVEYCDAQVLGKEFVSDPNNFRDAVHLHDGSSVAASEWLAATCAQTVQ